MPIIRRADGAQFTIHTYRELLKAQKPSLLKTEVTLLAENHGEYVRLFKQNKQIEAVFSSDAGFLLGESVWDYLGKPAHLIYCEALPERDQAIVVIIKDSSVYLDSKIPYDNLADEFSSLVGGAAYDIYIYGDVPISNKPEVGKFKLDESLIKSFHFSENSIFQSLPLNNAYQLQPLDLALRSTQLGKSSSKTVIFLLIILIILGMVWYFTSSKEEAPVHPASPLIVKGTPVIPLSTTLLASPAPGQILKQMSQLVGVLYTMPGWAPQKLSYETGTDTIEVTSLGGDLRELQRWATQNNIKMTLNGTSPQLSYTSELTNRQPDADVPPMESTLIKFIDRINRLFSAVGQLQVSAAKISAETKTVTGTLSYNGISPDILSLIGIQLNDFPVKIDRVDMSFSQGLLTGIINLTLVGK